MSVKSVIETKLEEALAPTYLEVLNESHQHNVPPGSESHFKVTVVSASFDGKRPVQRHQQVYQVLAEQLQQGVHALALHTFAPAEWQGVSLDSPNCLGGEKRGEKKG